MAYSPEERKRIQDNVCRGIAAGLSVGKICRNDPEMPNKNTIFEWLMVDKEFGDQYARARTARADARAERIDDICDDVEAKLIDPQAARVIIDAQKWQAGRENSKRYGDRTTVQGDAEADPVQVTDASKRDLARWIAHTLTQSQAAKGSAEK